MAEAKISEKEEEKVELDPEVCTLDEYDDRYNVDFEVN